jgi:hypothetical protein
MTIIQAKLAQLAQSIDGQVIANQTRVEVCVKGIIAGFPVTLEATKISYPFGVNYFLETGNFANRQVTPDTFKLTVMPRYMSGWLSLISRVLFFENRGQKLNLPQLEEALRFKYDNAAAAKRFAHYPGVAKNILELEKIARFNEILVNSSAGIYLSQPISFQALELGLCKEIFSIMAELGQVLFEAF